MKRTVLEPGVLAMFRLFAALWLGLLLLGGGTLLVWQGFSLVAVFLFLAGIANMVLLLGYLLWPQLPRYLRSAYLPGALVVASAGPIFITGLGHLILLAQLHSTETAILVGMWSLAAILFVPLVITAWQYDIRSVVGFCLGTALLDSTLLFLAVGEYSLYFFSIAHTILTRTLSFLLIGYMITRIMTTQRQQRRSLAEANTKLAHYAATLEQLATTRERNRLARELHDTLAHTLSAVAVEQEAVSALWDSDPAQARAMLEQSLSATRTGLAETRRALQALRSSPLEDFGLALAIRQEAESVAARANLALDLHIPERLDNLPPDVEQCIYRVAQEALANVAHHAQARRVEISLLKERGRLILRVSDDGHGFDPDTVDTEYHLGIRGMQERAEMVGGVLEIDSEPGQGVTVRLIVEERP